MVVIDVEWQPKRWWSRYQRGVITNSGGLGIDRIYRHAHTGQIRFYSDHSFNGVMVSVNAAPLIPMVKRGRFGKLYVQE